MAAVAEFRGKDARVLWPTYGPWRDVAAAFGLGEAYLEALSAEGPAIMRRLTRDPSPAGGKP